MCYFRIVLFRGVISLYRLFCRITLPGGRPRPKGDTSASPAPVEPMMRPKDRLAGLQQAMRIYLDKAKEADIGWDNIIDVCTFSTKKNSVFPVIEILSLLVTIPTAAYTIF